MFANNRPLVDGTNQFGSSSLLQKNGSAAVARITPPKNENYDHQLRKGADNPYLENKLPIDDSEFYREGWENGTPQHERLIEKNIYDLLISNPDFRSKCLRANYPMQKNTVYNKDYIPMKAEPNPPINPNAGFKPEKPMDLGTIHNNDYVPPAKFNVPEPDMPDKLNGAEHLQAPINKHTNYKLDYPDWGAIPKTGLLQPTNPKTLAIGMPFYDRQTYRDYGNFDMPPPPEKLNPEKGAKNPLGVDLPFIGDTSYGSYYRPFKVGPGSKGPKLDPVDDKTPGYDGQYKTIYQDYDGRGNPPIDTKPKPCCIVAPDQKIYMIDATTKSILENATPEMSQMILGDLAATAKKLGTIDGQEVYQAQELSKATKSKCCGGK